MGCVWRTNRCGSGSRTPGPFFHGTKADLKSGDLLDPGFSSNFGERRKANYVYLTATLDAATLGSRTGGGRGTRQDLPRGTHGPPRG